MSSLFLLIAAGLATSSPPNDGRGPQRDPGPAAATRPTQGRLLTLEEMRARAQLLARDAQFAGVEAIGPNTYRFRFLRGSATVILVDVDARTGRGRRH